MVPQKVLWIRKWILSSVIKFCRHSETIHLSFIGCCTICFDDKLTFWGWSEQDRLVAVFPIYIVLELLNFSLCGKLLGCTRCITMLHTSHISYPLSSNWFSLNDLVEDPTTLLSKLKLLSTAERFIQLGYLRVSIIRLDCSWVKRIHTNFSKSCYNGTWLNKLDQTLLNSMENWNLVTTFPRLSLCIHSPVLL